mmetsp:Transcript_30186/g.78381  ORF Transcript_30186/g.78381 Transcript_30186/m.78381 type:complete len:157 (-) Transcript_30186:2017-2487(-)
MFHEFVVDTKRAKASMAIYRGKRSTQDRAASSLLKSCCKGTDTRRVKYLAVGASKMPPAHKGVHEFTAPTMVHSTLTRNVLHGAGGSRGHPFIIAPANEYKATKSLLNKSWVACYFQSFQLLVSAYEGLRQQYLAIYGHHSDVAQVVASIVGLHSL